MTKKRSIHDCYANLEYDEVDVKKIESKLHAIKHDLCQKKIFQEINNFSQRFLAMATVIEENLPLCQSYVHHVDIVSTVNEYLNYYGRKFEISKLDKLEEKEEAINVINTLFNIVALRTRDIDEIMKVLFPIFLGMNSELYDERYYVHYTEIIILEDSDLHAVIKEIRNFSFDKIWIQEPLVSKLSSFMNEYKPARQFDIFRSKQELLDSISHSKKLSMISIWSEDIIAAKNLAASLNRDVTFINTFMDIYGSIVYFPYEEKLYKYKYICTVENKITSPKKQNTFDEPLYNLFYDGMWQKPVKDTYWLNEGHLWANTTNEDFERCIAAAEKGAKIWSIRSIDSRIQVLSELVHTLECNNKFELADIISKWTKSIHFYKNSLICPQSGRLEITVMPKPRGIITLKAKDLNVLFWQLTLALITGNSVIVLCNSVYCTLAPYCDMFSTSGVPPGVINMLSIEKMEHLSYPEYEIDETKFFSQEGKENLCMKFTIPKIIILPVK